MAITWDTVSYAVASRTVAPTTVDIVAGNALQLTTHAFASNGTEIYNQATSGWSSSNTSIASLTSSTGVQTASQYGAAWSNYTSTLNANLPGMATVTVLFGGTNISVPVTVRPPVTLTGYASQGLDTTNTYTAQTSHCNSTCSIHWVITYTDPNGVYHQDDYGTVTGTLSSISVGYTPNHLTYQVLVTITSNGISNSSGMAVTEQAGDGGGGGCDPSQIFCGE